MKITNELQTKTDSKFTRQPVTDANTFHSTLHSQTVQLKQQEIEKLMKNITMQGDKLARSRTFRDLAKFKRMIKDFLQETVSSGYKIEKDHSFGFGGNRQLSLVKEIDEKLLSLTEEIMGQEQKTVNILGLIGEIKGLLVNIYT
ncbi:YaaR family protein [Oceanobacillus bengalensis]|uniref:DUF327 family protein n=1 Tax=Oceanobacillus bengalensis TaxID=1435466 RepID=A0A494YUD0_9BACI|nr:YaaR family protein [Oceanobacillus bengalensis]RKQ13746.1 DUF327 family protein [Oceanobacillus bengalensis]